MIIGDGMAEYQVYQAPGAESSSSTSILNNSSITTLGGYLETPITKWQQSTPTETFDFSALEGQISNFKFFDSSKLGAQKLDNIYSAINIIKANMPQEELTYLQNYMNTLGTYSDFYQNYNQWLSEAQEEYDNLIKKSKESDGFLFFGKSSFATNEDLLKNNMYLVEDQILQVVGSYRNQIHDTNDLGMTYSEFMDLPSDEQVELVKQKSSYCQEFIETLEMDKKELDEMTKEMMGFDSYQAYQDKLAELQSQITLLSAASDNMNERIKMLPYNMLLERSDFQELYEKTYELGSLVECTSYDEVGMRIVNYTKYCEQNGAIPPAKLSSMLGSSCQLEEFVFDPLFQSLVDLGDPVMIATYDYLYQTKGKSDADFYLSKIENTLNQMQAEKNINAFYDSLDKNDEGKVRDSLRNHLMTYGQGFGDGAQDYAENLFSWFQKDGVKSVNEWEQIYCLAKLQETDTFLDKTYQAGVWSGQTASMAAVTLLTSHVTGGAYLNQILNVASSTGNTYHNHSAAGDDMALSVFYTVLSACTDQLTGKMMGRLSNYSDFFFDIDTLPADSFKVRIYNSIKKKGIKETKKVTNGVVHTGEQKLVFGADIDWTQITDEALDDYLADLWVQGSMSSDGCVQVLYGDQRYNVNVADALQYVETNQDKMTSREAFKEYMIQQSA